MAAVALERGGRVGRILCERDGVEAPWFCGAVMPRRSDAALLPMQRCGAGAFRSFVSGLAAAWPVPPRSGTLGNGRSSLRIKCGAACIAF